MGAGILPTTIHKTSCIFYSVKKINTRIQPMDFLILEAEQTTPNLISKLL